jgi:hypothetical protein
MFFYKAEVAYGMVVPPLVIKGLNGRDIKTGENDLSGENLDIGETMQRSLVIHMTQEI